MAAVEIAKEEKKMRRVFMFNGTRLEDPGKQLDEKEVKKIHAQRFPQITNASVAAKEENGVRTITYTPAVGTKG